MISPPSACQLEIRRTGWISAMVSHNTYIQSLCVLGHIRREWDSGSGRCHRLTSVGRCCSPALTSRIPSLHSHHLGLQLHPPSRAAAASDPAVPHLRSPRLLASICRSQDVQKVRRHVHPHACRPRTADPMNFGTLTGSNRPRTSRAKSA